MVASSLYPDLECASRGGSRSIASTTPRREGAVIGHPSRGFSGVGDRNGELVVPDIYHDHDRLGRNWSSMNNNETHLQGCRKMAAQQTPDVRVEEPDGPVQAPPEVSVKDSLRSYQRDVPGDLWSLAGDAARLDEGLQRGALQADYSPSST